jgi:two-component system, sensor histidine kinase and response regulator
MVTAIGHPAEEHSLRTKASSRPALTRGLHVLLAEDNRVNQTVATKILKKLGHRVTVVSNGAEALQVVQSKVFDLIAMDIQMPQMDGLEATRAIREWEASRDRHIPIIAMTAHAMKGDRELCLEAGMDGYVSKPIRPDDLAAAIAEVLGATDQLAIDNAALMSWLDNNHSLLRDIARMFMEDSQQQITAMESALAAKDSEKLHFAAHALKGSVGNFRAQLAFALAQEMEVAAKAGDLDKAAQLLPKLSSEIAKVRRELAALIASAPKKAKRQRAR